MQPGLGLPPIEYAERSDPGRDPDKQVNEDFCGRLETRFGHLCVVCDGMGGHASGREAAELALTTIFETFGQAPDDTAPSQVLRAAIEQASLRVYGMATSEVALGRPGSTVVAILLHGAGTEVAHVGDSRAYYIHEGRISRVTRDHSIVQELVDRGLLSLEQAPQHPDANRITRALGMGPDVEVEVRPQPLAHVAGDAFVLCSDGLCDLVQDSEILAIVGSEPAEQAAAKLVDVANARGGHDNVTVIVLRARESAIPAGGSIAATVVQTVANPMPPVTPATETVVDPRPQRAAEPAFAARPLEPTPPPPSAPSSSKHGAAIVAVAVTAFIAIALAADLLVGRVMPRRGNRGDASPDPSAASFVAPDANADGASVHATESVVVPSQSAPPSETIAPLEPSPATQKTRKKRSR
jgi:protein phosphatase